MGKGKHETDHHGWAWVDCDAFINEEEKNQDCGWEAEKQLHVRCTEFEMLEGHSHKELEATRQ